VPHKPKKSRGALIALLVVVCLLGGVAAGTFLVAPGIGNIQNTLPGGVAMQPDSAMQTKPALTDDQTTEVPEIGGADPNIEGTASPIVQIAKEVGPSVVGVAVSVNQPILGQQGPTEQESGYGTGIIITQDGYIVTNNHVIDGSDSVNITLFDGTEYPATIVGTDATTDLAVLKIDATGLTPAALGDSEALEVGETVVAIGNPLGASLAGSVTSGIVSALNRNISPNGYSQKYIQTDAAINPGNSGGALVNMKGQVIGINTLKTYLAGYDDYGVPIGTEGIGFAIPINSAKPIVEQLIATGSVQRPGIGIKCLVDETNQYNAAGAPAGVTVVDVTENGPAAQAGLEAYDIITSIDGTAADSVETLTAVIQSHNIGDQIELTVWRNGQEYKAVVTVGDLNNMS
jgi:serine protease Do